jgi:integrase
MVLIAFRHGWRPVEATELRWDAVDFDRGHLHVSRAKGSEDSTRPLSGRELRALRRLKREQDPPSAFVFTSERGLHQLRHACGYKLANQGVDTRTLQEFLGHRDIRNTVTRVLAQVVFGGEKQDAVPEMSSCSPTNRTPIR